jgi:hypothetical protein
LKSKILVLFFFVLVVLQLKRPMGHTAIHKLDMGKVQYHGGLQNWPTLMADLAYLNLSKYKKTGAEFQVKALAKRY